MDADGNFNIDLTEGVERFNHKVLFLAGECQKVSGAEWQQRQMALFRETELAVIPDAGHEMFAENPEASVAAVKEYSNTPVLEIDDTR